MGETRFIFTLISPEGIFNTGPVTDPGMPPKFGDQAEENPSKGFADWEGMNVIIEYKNPFSTLCQLQDYAQDWVDLSGLTLGSSSYNDALQDITDQVTAANASPNEPNGSALSQIRTNERLLGTFSARSWEDSFWEMRQFEINEETHLLEQVPVINTPVNNTNNALNLSQAPAYPSNNSTNVNGLHDWSFNLQNRSNVLEGRHDIPLEFPNSTNEMLAGAAQLDAEFTQYWDFNWDIGNPYYDNGWMFDNQNFTDYKTKKRIRQQISLNTCQGCHGGENKVLFTQVRPLGYGESAEYWNAIPDYQERVVDTRNGNGFPENDGVTTTNEVTGADKPNYPFNSSEEYLTNVSAFITGRSYTGTIGNGTFADDLESPIDDPDDPNMTGLYYVMDPSNAGQDYQNYKFSNGKKVPRKEKYYGFNELERRKDDLCQFLETDCDASPGVTEIFLLINKNMLNPDIH